MNEDQNQPDPQDEDLSGAIAEAVSRRNAGRYDVGHTSQRSAEVEASVNRIRRARAGL